MGGQFNVGTNGDIDSIACAVNTFGQDEIYNVPYNRYCFNGIYTTSGFGDIVIVLF